MSSETLCFQCGQPAGNPLRLNHMPNGTVCSVCRDRLLDALPAPFPAPVSREESHPAVTSEAAVSEESDVTEPAQGEEASERPTLRAVPPPDGEEPHPFGDDGFKPSA